MKAVLQRVSYAKVCVNNVTVGEIEQGFLVLLGVENGDAQADADVLSSKIANLRVFTDENDKMNLSLLDTGLSVLVISQFTLLADCKKGRRPNFLRAAKPETANELYEYFCEKIKTDGVANVQKGVFGEDMKVSLLNDGPVTIILDSGELKK